MEGHYPQHPQMPKRPASPSAELVMPPAKLPKTGVAQLQINYLKREKKETIPLASAEEPMPRLIKLIGEYDGVLQRHESLAGNLGACPVGPILLKRFERLFEGPPRILKSNSREPNITWLDVVEFAQNKPEQFDLEKTRNGIRVCQFYLKQCRVEISEEDYVLIRSGMPQKLIPAQPILEDEEKELGVLEVLDRTLLKVVHQADQVSARARQLVHRLKHRRAAILARREGEGVTQPNVLKSNDSPASPAYSNTDPSQRPEPVAVPSVMSATSPALPSGGFTAVNARHTAPLAEAQPYNPIRDSLQQEQEHANRNGEISMQHFASQTPQEASYGLSRFLTPSEKAAGMTAETVRRDMLNLPPRSTSRERQLQQEELAHIAAEARRAEAVATAARRESDISMIQAPEPHQQQEPQPTVMAIPNTPSSLLPQHKPQIYPRDDGGVHKAEMIARMETLKKGERVVPPCDRCRRLQMDCMKNLTACQGCTKKHAKCCWKDVTSKELAATREEAERRAAEYAASTAAEGEVSGLEWDNIFSQQKGGERDSREQDSPPTANTGDVSMMSDVQPEPQLRSQSRRPSPPQSNGRPSQASPKLDVRPPPLPFDQQLREAVTDPPGPQTLSISTPQRVPSPPRPQSSVKPSTKAHSEFYKQAYPIDYAYADAQAAKREEQRQLEQVQREQLHREQLEAQQSQRASPEYNANKFREHEQERQAKIHREREANRVREQERQNSERLEQERRQHQQNTSQPQHQQQNQQKRQSLPGPTGDFTAVRSGSVPANQMRREVDDGDGDRLAAIAHQVYRSVSQNTQRREGEGIS